MTEYTITRENASLDLQALRSIIARTSGDHEDYPAWYRLREIADSIEEQVKPAIEEPTEFGSIVRARQSDERGPELWAPTPWHGEHYWRTEDGWTAVWSELTEVEVLRVGVGECGVTREDLAYSKGVEGFAEKVRRELRALEASVITGPEKRTCRDALALVAALRGEG